MRHPRFAGGTSPELDRELLVQRPAVAVVPWDPQTDRVVLTEQYRMGLLDAPQGALSVECVAGIIDGEESAEAAAMRECEEETGLRPRRLERVGAYRSSPGGSTELVTCFVAEIAAPVAGGLYGVAGEHEDIRVLVVDLAEAAAWLDAGRIVAANAVIPLQQLLLRHAALRATWRRAEGAVAGDATGR